MMNKTFLFLMLVIAFGCNNQNTGKSNDSLTDRPAAIRDTSDKTNNFYDNETIYNLKVEKIEIAGEINNPGYVDLETLPLRSVIVKETLPSNQENSFVGAYRYDGYSLFDILNLCTPNKENQDEFKPIIDLLVVVENAKGEKAVFSWGEIYYANHLHEIIYATKVMRIVPSKTHELWPLPENAKIVANNDLLTSRNIESPVKITVKSVDRSFDVEKGMSPMFAPDIDIFVNGSKTMTINKPSQNINNITFETTFYGRGRGIHSTTPFTGQMVKDVLAGQIRHSAENLRTGFLIIAAKDGYRGVYSYSEIFNRNDQAELLLIHIPEDNNGGAFRLFPAGDFFSDRAILSVNRIYFESID
jgi:hypothetical protein